MTADKNRPQFAAPLDVRRVCIAPDAPWDQRNDQLIEAILLSNVQPKPAYDQICELLEKGININARHPEGHTALELAKFNVCNNSVIDLLTYAGTEGSATVEAAARTAAPPDPSSEIHTLPIEFRGTAREYFRIWAVNLCLTLLTLGVYSAWAKVRKKRYFYSHTTLDGTPFQYLGEPMPILKGRVVAVLLFLLWFVSSHFFVFLIPVVIILGVILAPWVIVRSAAFNARYSAFRNMTFSFSGTYRDGFMAIYFWGIIPALAIVAAVKWGETSSAVAVGLLALLSIAFPFWIARVKRFLAQHTHFGGQRGQLSVSGGQYYYIYFIGGFIAIGVGIIGGIAGFIIGRVLEVVGLAPEYVVFVSLLPVYLSYLVVYAYIQAKSGNLVWNNTQLGALRFQSALTGGGLATLYFTNVLGILVSFGMLIPWAVVRTFKYRADHLRGLLRGDYSGFRGGESTTVQAAGAEVGEIFDLDVSL